MNYSRRSFLTKISAGTSILSLPSISARSNSPTIPQKKLGVALVGLGYYSEHKLATALQLTSNCYLAGAVTGTPSKIDKWKKQFKVPEKNFYNYQTFDRIAENKDIDIVYVVLPNSMHHEFVIRAAKAGKHVICEKPMAVSVRECEEMIAACKQAGVKLSIGYRLHFEPYTQEAMRVGQQKVFGTVKIVESSMGFKIGDPTQWRLNKTLAGGGAMMDVGVYAIQGARYATGEEPVSVTAQEYKTDHVKFKDVDETILWQMEFPSGIVANCMTSYATHVERLYIAAEDGSLELRPAFGYGPIAGRTSKGELNFPHVNHQQLQLEDFASCVLANKESRVPGEEGLRDAKVIEAIYKAVKTGGKVMV